MEPISSNNLTKATLEDLNAVTMEGFVEELFKQEFKEKLLKAMKDALQSKKMMYIELQKTISDKVIEGQYDVVKTLCQYGERKSEFDYKKEDGTLGTVEITKGQMNDEFMQRFNRTCFEEKHQIVKLKKLLEQTFGLDPQFEECNDANKGLRSKKNTYKPIDLTLVNYEKQCLSLPKDWLSVREKTEVDLKNQKNKKKEEKNDEDIPDDNSPYYNVHRLLVKELPEPPQALFQQLAEAKENWEDVWERSDLKMQLTLIWNQLLKKNVEFSNAVEKLEKVQGVFGDTFAKTYLESVRNATNFQTFNATIKQMLEKNNSTVETSALREVFEKVYKPLAVYIIDNRKDNMVLKEIWETAKKSVQGANNLWTGIQGLQIAINQEIQKDKDDSNEDEDNKDDNDDESGDDVQLTTKKAKKEDTKLEMGRDFIRGLGGDAAENTGASRRATDTESEDKGLWRGGTGLLGIVKEENREYINNMQKYDRVVDILQKIEKRMNSDPAVQYRAFCQAIVDFQRLIGRVDIQDNIARFCKAFVNNPLTFESQYLTFSLLGGAGTGKTDVAKRLAKVLASLGILIDGQVEVSSRATLIGQYLGETADKVRNVLTSNYENVVFIDEAYSIAQGTEGRYDDYGVEALNELTGFLDKNKGRIAVIVAGYKCEMEQYFFNVNPGLRRRFKNNWTFKPYTPDELLCILNKMLTDNYEKGLSGFLNQDAMDLLNGFLKARIEADDAVEFSNIAPGEYIYRRLLADEGGSMELLASKISDFSNGALAGRSLTEDNILKILLEEIFERDGNTIVRGLDAFDNEAEQCVEEYYPGIWEHSDDPSKIEEDMLRAEGEIKERIERQRQQINSYSDCAQIEDRCVLDQDEKWYEEKQFRIPTASRRTQQYPQSLMDLDENSVPTADPETIRGVYDYIRANDGSTYKNISSSSSFQRVPTQKILDYLVSKEVISRGGPKDRFTATYSARVPEEPETIATGKTSVNPSRPKRNATQLNSGPESQPNRGSTRTLTKREREAAKDIEQIKRYQDSLKTAPTRAQRAASRKGGGFLPPNF